MPGSSALAAPQAAATPGFMQADSISALNTLQQLSATAAVVPSGFQESVVFSGLTNPTAVRFASDGRVFVAEKRGIVKEFDSLTSTVPTVVADLRSSVDDYWDRGLLGLALDPNFPTTPYIYLAYTFDAPIGGTAPVWERWVPEPAGSDDGRLCGQRPARPDSGGGETRWSVVSRCCSTTGVRSIRVTRSAISCSALTERLYMSGGDGASFTFTDFGQGGGSAGSPTLKNPCGDPPVPAGGTQAPPTAEGGSLRSQSIRRAAGEPVSLDGTILRLDPATGAALPDNPAAANPNSNARRIMAFGLRNPFRFAFRPGTSELWAGDVGEGTWEEINRIVTPTGPQKNFGWPCYEGAAPHSGFQSAGVNLCTSLYSSGTATAPYHTYAHSASVVPGDGCPTANGSSLSAVGFYQGGSSIRPRTTAPLFSATTAQLHLGDARWCERAA